MPGDRLVDTFLELVRIDSPSGRESAVAGYCAGALEAIGFDVCFDESKERTGSDTGNLVAVLPGTTAGLTLLLSAHMDCVQPCTGVEPVIEDGVVSSAGDTVLGADDKAGLAVILEAVQRIVEESREHAGLGVILTVSEETGLTGAKALDPSELAGDLCLVLDADGEPGGIVVGAPTHYTFEATFSGTASHAGVAPETGRSALVMASDAVREMQLGRLDELTTANVGTIAGGTATNVVPAFAEMTGECRSIDRERVEEVRADMSAVIMRAAESTGGTVELEWTLEYEGFRFSESDPLVQLVSSACLDVGITPRTFMTGGGSDGSIFSAGGMPTLVLSCGMQNVHGTDEKMAISDLHALLDLVLAVAARAVEED